MKTLLLLAGFASLSISCATARQNPNLPNLVSESEYYSSAQQYTAEKQVYDGFNQTMGLSATLLNSKVTDQQNDLKARIYQWTPEQYNTGKSENQTSMSKETKIFLSFFVPDRKHDDMNKPTTLWKIFLDAGGRRYEGKATKMKTIFADVASLYPNHNRFSTPYMLTFPVPVSQIENTESKLTLTGPVGSVTVDFKEAQ